MVDGWVFGEFKEGGIRGGVIGGECEFGGERF